MDRSHGAYCILAAGSSCIGDFKNQRQNCMTEEIQMGTWMLISLKLHAITLPLPGVLSL